MSSPYVLLSTVARKDLGINWKVAERSRPTPKDPGSNPGIINFLKNMYFLLLNVYQEKTKNREEEDDNGPLINLI